MYCQHCGKSLEAASRFCEGCGQPVSEVNSAAGVHVPAAPPPSTPRVSSTQALSTPGGHSRPRGVTYIFVLSIIAGLFWCIIGFGFLFGAFSVDVATNWPGISTLIWFIGLFTPIVNQFTDKMVHNEISTGVVGLALATGYFFVAINLFRLKELSGRIAAIVFSVIVILRAAYLINTGVDSATWHLIAIGFNVWVIYYLCKATIRKSFTLENRTPEPAAIS